MSHVLAPLLTEQKQWRDNIWVVNQLVINDVSSTKVSKTITSPCQVEFLILVIGAALQEKEYVYKIPHSDRSAEILCLTGINTDSRDRSLSTSTNIICSKMTPSRIQVKPGTVRRRNSREHEVPDGQRCQYRPLALIQASKTRLLDSLPARGSRKRYIQQCLKLGPMRDTSAQVLGMNNKWAYIQSCMSVRLRMLDSSVSSKIDFELVWQRDPVRPILGVV